MAHGCPAVASDLPALREIGGQAAIYCQPGDVSGWTETVTQALRRRLYEPAGWSDLRCRSMAHARGFSWRRTAALMAGVYQEVARENDAARCLRLPLKADTPGGGTVCGPSREEQSFAPAHAR